MKTPAEAMERLGGLASQDRAWILRNLSSGARRRLLQQTARERGDLEGARTAPLASEGAGNKPTDADEAATRDEEVLDAMDGELVAAALASEPPWIIALLLGLRAWSWEGEVLTRVTPVTRHEVGRLRLLASSASQSMRRLLVRIVRERVAGSALPAVGFERLLQHARSAEVRF